MRNYKGKIYTVVMVAVSLCIVFGGWFLTKELLNRREREFLGGSGAVALRSSQTGLLAQKEADEEASAFKEQEIPEEQMQEILLLWDLGRKEMPHDPKDGQMNMEQAIEAGKKWIAVLAEHEVVPYELINGDFDRITAQLGTVEAETETDLDERLLSRWVLEYRKDDVDINLTIHAMSGEVWYASVSLMSYSSSAYMYDDLELLELMFPRAKGGYEEVAAESYEPLIIALEKGLVHVSFSFQTKGTAQAMPFFEISFWLTP